MASGADYGPDARPGDLPEATTPTASTSYGPHHNWRIELLVVGSLALDTLDESIGEVACSVVLDVDS